MKIGVITDSVREQSTGIGFYTKDVVNKMLKKIKKINTFLLIISKLNLIKRILSLSVILSDIIKQFFGMHSCHIEFEIET